MGLVVVVVGGDGEREREMKVPSPSSSAAAKGFSFVALWPMQKARRQVDELVGMVGEMRL